MRCYILFALSTALLYGLYSGEAQVRWFKYSGNPVLEPGPSGAWDNYATRIDRVLFFGGGYGFFMWYTGYKNGVEAGPGVIPQIGSAISPDGVRWWKDQANPVLNAGGNTWDGEGVLRPFVLWTRGGGLGHMWYTAVGSGPKFRVGYAHYSEGTWRKRESGIPVLTPDSGWQSSGVEHPTMVRSDTSDGYKIWYQGMPGYGVGYATAQDETTWSKQSGPVSGIGKVYYPRVLFDGNSYEMWYNIGSSQSADIGYATSPDGFNWKPSPQNPVLRRGSAGSWDEMGILTGDVMADFTDRGQLYRLWYAGRDMNRYRSGYAVSPKGLVLEVPGDTVKAGDTVWVSVSVSSPHFLSFSTIVRNGSNRDTLLLLDDGARSDGSAGDGKFGNGWASRGSGRWTFDLGLEVSGVFDTVQRFEPWRDADFIYVEAPDAVSSGSSIPAAFGLFQNYPNPFNPSTVIEYQLPVSGSVRLEVYDILGRKVATPADSHEGAGRHEVTFHAAELASGTYIYRLTAGSFVQSRRMLLLR